MHMDDLGKIGWKLGEIKVCTSYLYNQSNSWPITIDYVPIDSENCEPIYKSFKGGWDTSECNDYDSLPQPAKNFIEFIEEYLAIPVMYIGIGPDIHDIIIK